MKADQLSHSVAMYMRSLFFHRLAVATSKKELPPVPDPPEFVSETFLAACDSAVRMIVAAFRNIGKHDLIILEQQCANLSVSIP